MIKRTHNLVRTPPVYIDKVSFSPLTAYDIVHTSAIKISNREVVRGGLPVSGGLYDARMGTTDKSYICATCEQDKQHCPGHPGHIELSYPVPSPIGVLVLIKWLKITCFTCGYVFIDSVHSKDRKAMLSEAVIKVRSQIRSTVGLKCPVCSSIKDSVEIMDDNMTVYIQQSEDSTKKKVKADTFRRRVFPHEMLNVVNRIPMAILEEKGFPPEAHPRNYIYTSVPVIPNAARANVMRQGRFNANDATTALSTIITTSAAVASAIPSLSTININRDVIVIKELETTPTTPESIAHRKMIEIAIDKLTGDVMGMIRGGEIKSSRGTPQSLTSRIPGKHGRIRGTLLGRRAHETGRSIITGDPKVPIDGVGLPLSMARQLTMKEVVTYENRKRLTTYLFNGYMDKYPAAHRITRVSTNQSYLVSNSVVNQLTNLEIGDIVHRELIDGDVVLINRPPSLTFSSIGAHRVMVVADTDTIRINVSACNLYNADFDGDAMMVIVPSSTYARTEVSILSNVRNWLISFKGNPMIGLFQDSLIGAFKFTRDDAVYDRQTALAIMSDIRYDWFNPRSLTELLENKKTVTGRELISLVLPEITYDRKTAYYDEAFAGVFKYAPSERKVTIRRGKMIDGVLDKKTVGQSNVGSIFEVIFNEFGQRRAIETIYAMQQIVGNALAVDGLSLGLPDMMLPNSVKKTIDIEMGAIIASAEEINDRIYSSKVIAPIGKTVHQYYEELIMSRLTLGDTVFMHVMNAVSDKKNSFIEIVLSGSKGNKNNIMQSAGAGNQITIGDQRPPADFDVGRMLPHFQRFDMDPRIFGFITSSFIRGLNPIEFYQAAREARRAITTKAISTSKTGAANRIACLCLSELISNYFRGVSVGATPDAVICQQLYGDNGFDPRRMRRVRVPTIMMSDAEFKKYNLHADEFKQLSKDREFMRSIIMNSVTACSSLRFDGELTIPVDPVTTLNDTIVELEGVGGKLDIDKAWKSVNNTTNNLKYIFFSDKVRHNSEKVPDYFEAAVYPIAVAIRATFASYITKSLKCTNEIIELALQKMMVKLTLTLIDHGMSVGVQAAQNITEPLTQYVLDAHHRSGGSGTSGDIIESIFEVLNARKTASLKAPRMFLGVKDSFSNDINRIANNIEMLPFSRFLNRVDSMMIFFEHYGEPVHPEFKREEVIIALYEKHNPTPGPPTDLVNWCIRFRLARNEMILKNISIAVIAESLRNAFPDIYIIHNPESSKQIIMRIYIRRSYFGNKQADFQSVLGLAESISNTPVRGIQDIVSAHVVDREIMAESDSGELIHIKRQFIETQGTNFALALSNPAVDADVSYTTAIIELYETLGIEAARLSIINQLKESLKEIDAAHIITYADMMTVTGAVSALAPDGIKHRRNDNVMLRAAAGGPIQVFEESSASIRTDKITSPIASFMIGQMPKFGSWYSEISIDESIYHNRPAEVQGQLASL